MDLDLTMEWTSLSLAIRAMISQASAAVRARWTLRPLGLGLAFELLEKFLHVVGGGVLGGGDFRHQFRNVHAGEGVGPGGAVGHGELVQGLPLEVVFQGFAQLLAVLREGGGVLHVICPPK